VANNTIDIAEGTPTKKLASQSFTRGVDTVHQEEVVIGDGTTDGRIATVTAANALKVDGSAVTQPVSDGGGALTVDALDLDIRNLAPATDEVKVTGAAADGAAVAGNPVLIAGQDGTLTQSIKTDAAGELQVDVLTQPALSHATDSVRIGDGTDLALVSAAGALLVDGSAVTQPVSGTVTANQGTPAATANRWPVQITDGTDLALVTAAGALVVDGSAVTQPVSGTVTAAQATAASLNAEVQGDAAHDAVASGNPVQVGSVASLDEPTAVADGDAVRFWTDQFGRQVVLQGHSDPEPPVTANGSAAGLSVIAAPGASVSLHICKGSLHNRGVEQVVSLRDGAAGTIRFTANLAADGGGSLFDFGSRGWKLTANTALIADIAAASVDVNITEYYIAP